MPDDLREQLLLDVLNFMVLVADELLVRVVLLVDVVVELVQLILNLEREDEGVRRGRRSSVTERAAEQRTASG